MAKIDWKFWKGFIVGGLAVLALVIGIITDVAGVLKRAKPQILDAQNCHVRPFDAPEGYIDARFELLINNAGTKDCSLTSIDLTWPNGLDTELYVSLPKTIPAGLTEKVAIEGQGRLELKSNQTTAEATVRVEFNTKHVIKRKIIFTIERF